VKVARAGSCPPQANEVTLLLPKQETRQLDGNGKIVSDRIGGDWREVRLAL